MSPVVGVTCYLTCGLIYLIGRSILSSDEETTMKQKSMEHLPVKTILLAALVGVLVMTPIWPVLWIEDIISDIRRHNDSK